MNNELNDFLEYLEFINEIDCLWFCIVVYLSITLFYITKNSLNKDKKVNSKKKFKPKCKRFHNKQSWCESNVMSYVNNK